MRAMPGSRSHIALRAARVAALLLLIHSCAMGAATPIPMPKPSRPVFVEKPFGPLPPETPTPARHAALEEDKPIPRMWIIGGISIFALIVAALLYGSQRAWRSSNLFDREYRFPLEREPALRFGGQKSGGHLATIQFSEKSASTDQAVLKAKDV